MPYFSSQFSPQNSWCLQTDLCWYGEISVTHLDRSVVLHDFSPLWQILPSQSLRVLSMRVQTAVAQAHSERVLTGPPAKHALLRHLAAPFCVVVPSSSPINGTPQLVPSHLHLRMTDLSMSARWRAWAPPSQRACLWWLVCFTSSWLLAMKGPLLWALSISALGCASFSYRFWNPFWIVITKGLGDSPSSGHMCCKYFQWVQFIISFCVWCAFVTGKFYILIWLHLTIFSICAFYNFGNPSLHEHHNSFIFSKFLNFTSQVRIFTPRKGCFWLGWGGVLRHFPTEMSMPPCSWPASVAPLGEATSKAPDSLQSISFLGYTCGSFIWSTWLSRNQNHTVFGNVKLSKTWYF